MMQRTQNTKAETLLDTVLKKCKNVFLTNYVFSFFTNLFMLAVPIYSLQVLDRVISSGSMETLTMLTIVVTAIFIAFSLIQMTRTFLLIRVSEWFDRQLSHTFFANSVTIATMKNTVGGSQNLRDLNSLRGFLTSAGINTLFDAPWALLYIGILFMIHPAIGWLAVGGSIIILIFAYLNAYATDSVLTEANQMQVASNNQVEMAVRNAESIEAMGMMPAIINQWSTTNQKLIEKQSLASYRNGIIMNLSRFVRLMLQVGIIGIGAYYTLNGQMSVGAMIAGSILVARALAPFESAIETWKSVVSTYLAYTRLRKTLLTVPKRGDALDLPAPQGNLSVENVMFLPPGSVTPGTAPKYTIKGVSFPLVKGDILAMVGPSAAGKSTLAKMIVGVWKPTTGHVRLDSADVYQWNREHFGQHVGYLPQSVELFNGTVKDNIARFRENVASEDIIKAAKIAGIHEMILRLPNGYETDVGPNGAALSAGQRQRVGLARAFFGDPSLVVLDEPNANLDDAGEAALAHALIYAKQHAITTIVISHRTNVLQAVDKILVLKDGATLAFGPRDEVLKKLAQQNQQAQAATQNQAAPTAQLQAVSKPTTTSNPS